MPLYKTRAVVLRRRELGEADELITLISPSHGRITAVAKGSRKIRSALAGRVEPFTHLDLLLAKGRSLDVISQSRVVDSHRGLLGDLGRLAHGAYFLELVDSFIIDEDRVSGVFTLLLKALKSLECGVDPDLLSRWMELHLTAELGYALFLERCYVCGNESVAAMVERDGSVCCAPCAREAPGSMAVDPRTVELLRYLQRVDSQVLCRLRVDPATRDRMRSLLQRHLQERWPHRFRSVDFLKALRTTEKKERSAA